MLCLQTNEVATVTTYLCTVGTSADKSNVGPDRAAILGSFNQFPFAEESTQALSAELHSLFRLGLSAQDRVIFYHSETPEGASCAGALGDYLDDKLPGIAVEWREIKGLQVNDAKRFRECGVVNFFKAVNDDLDRYGSQFCVLNPTGGYKALVPYTALLGMLRQVPVRYIFERSKELLELPSFPLDFPTTLLQILSELQTKLEIESSIPLADLQLLIDNSTIDVLFETHGADATLSAIGHLLLDRLKEKRAKIVYVSSEAFKGILKLEAACNCIDYLQRCASNPSALKTAQHANIGNGFSWLKPGNTTDRYLVTIENWKLLVWKAVDHAEYEALSKLDTSELLRRRSSHGPFFRLDYVQ
jgi:putative CRISPR-associated protein (TIGR02619 family)